MQILLLLVLTVALYFAAAFAGELFESQRIARQVASITADIQRLKTENARLTKETANARTDAFIKQEARDKLGLVKPGDVPIVVVNAPSATPTPALSPTPTPQAHWQKWAQILQQ